MLEITVRTESGRRYVRPTAEEFAGLFRRIGGRGDNFLVVQRIPDLPEVFAQVWHETGGGYRLEHRDGGPDRHFWATLDGPEPVIAAMTGWARREEGWDVGPDWTPLDLGPAPDVPPLRLSDEDREELEEHLREMLVGGYATRAELAESAQDHLASGNGPRPVSPEQARALVDRMWLERVGEQAGWEGETDPERLTRAFEALEEAGITARENFTCCSTCGHAEIGGEASPGSRGFVFFHSQDTDSAAAGYGLSLQYGGFDDSPETTAAIGREVAAALVAAGLPVEWNGDPGHAVRVAPLDWRKRLVG
ncbi:hypothetical protein GCM10010420_33480 [Streptomyces glaucosporus]|uniref:DUF6891 domain-containing protein n=1 Tax=Streptomyces glaucosporus TaxID=284044 RepID=A0ABN3IHD3_9ACTN